MVATVAATGASLAMASASVESTDQVRFTAVGDYASGAPAGAVLDAVAARNPDAHFALGDLSYAETGKEGAWCDFVLRHVGEGFPFELMAGNHESNGLNGNINDFAACLPNQLSGLVGTYGRQYYVDVPATNPMVRFLMLSPGLTFPDGTWSYDAGTPRYRWTERAIDGAHARGIPWVVAGIHKPCLSLGRYACDIGPDLVNMMMAKQVDAVLMGHEHNYQRTHQLDLRAGCTSLTIGGFDADCVADSDRQMVAGSGTVFSVIGTGGAVERDTYPDDPEAGYFAATVGLADAPEFGFGDFVATPTQLSMRFVSTSSSYTDGFTLTKEPEPVPNQAPAASFTTSLTGLATAMNGAASSDPDGVIVLYDWNFGDGESAAGARPTHTYAAPGTYDVTLRVTDDRGRTAETVRQVTVTAPSSPGSTVLATDSFGRTLSSGWGTADTGGGWTTAPTSGVWSVTGGAGIARLATPGVAGSSAYLKGVSTDELDLRVGLALSARPTGGRLDQTLVLRRRSSDSYRAVVRVLGTGAVEVLLNRSVAGSSTALSGVLAVPGLSYSVGDRLLVRAQATGTAPTTLRAKVWKAGTPEPSAWTATAIDSASALQGAGYPGFSPYLTSAVSTGPVQVSYDDLVIAGTGLAR